MINYPKGNWSSDFEIPEDFVEEFEYFNTNTANEKSSNLRFRLYERLFIMWLAAKEVSDLDGDFVECGVYAGFTSYFMALHCKTKIHLFDSWEGITDFTEYDNDYYKANSFKIPVSTAEKTLSRFNNTVFHQGEVPFDFDQLEKISLLHIDMDNYNPTKIALEGLWDKVVDGGIVVVDFHDGWATGAEKATNDFFIGKREITMFPTGKALIVK
jgi:O-methyltransferase